MPSPFDDLHAEMTAVIVDTFGETRARLIPRIPETSQYKARASDPARQAILVFGVFTYAPADERLQGQVRGDGLGGPTRVSMSAAEFWMGQEMLSQIPYSIQKGDVIELLDRPNSPRFAVSNMQQSHMGEMNLILVKEDFAP